MGFIKLHSSNPKLSFVIKKNPNSGMVMRKYVIPSSFAFFPPSLPLSFFFIIYFFTNFIYFSYFFLRVRKGTVFGWYSQEDTYNIFFEDSLTETSFNSGDYEYVPLQSLSTSLLLPLSPFLFVSFSCFLFLLLYPPPNFSIPSPFLSLFSPLSSSRSLF